MNSLIRRTAHLPEFRAHNEEIERLERACSLQQQEISNTLGEALGFPRFCDDQKNFPGAAPEDGYCTGQYVAEDLAIMAADRIQKLEAELKEMKERERDRQLEARFNDW